MQFNIKTGIITIFGFALVGLLLMVLSFAAGGDGKKLSFDPVSHVGSSIDQAAHLGQHLQFGSNAGAVGFDDTLTQPYLALHNPFAAWDITRGKGAKIGICETGFLDTNHPDLKGQFVYGTIEQNNEAWTKMSGTPTTLNGTSHKLSVALIMAGLKNDTGFTGIAPEAEYYAHNALAWVNSNYDDEEFSCISQLSKRGVRAINHSQTIGDIFSGMLNDEFRKDLDYAQSKGSLVIDTAGNNTNQRIIERHPARITVGAVNRSGLEPKSFHTTGPALDIVAYNDFAYWYTGFPATLNYTGIGTSGAAPQVTATIGLMISVNPSLTSEQIKTILFETADDRREPGHDEIYGHGLLDISEAVLCAQNFTGSCTNESSGSDLTLSVHASNASPQQYSFDSVIRNVGTKPNKGRVMVHYEIGSLPGLNGAEQAETLYGNG